MKRPLIELIIFDLDGTLVDSRKDIIGSINFTLKSVGLKEKNGPLIISYVGDGVEALMRRSIGEDKDGLFEKALSIFKEYYGRHCADNAILYSGVSETLAHFSGKKKIIITNRGLKSAVCILKALNIYDYFNKIAGGDDIRCMKPNPCPLDNALARFKIHDKNKAMMVGDMDIDVLAGKNAGILTCAAAYGFGSREDIIKANPDYIIDSIPELKAIIN